MEKEDMQKNPGLRMQFWQLGRSALFPSILHGSFVFHSPTEEVSSKRQGWGQSPPAQRQLPTGSVTAVTLFRSHQRQQWMTWGWCSPAPGLIGPSSGLNAKVSWQREAEKPDFPVPTRLREHGGCWEARGIAGEEQRAGPPALLQVSSARYRAVPQPRPGSWDEFHSVRVSGAAGSDSARCLRRHLCSRTDRQRRSWLQLGVGMGKSLVFGGS